MVLRPVALAIAALFVLLSRALRPWILVRYGRLDVGRIGMLAAVPEIYVSERDAGLADRGTIDLFYPEGLVLPRDGRARRREGGASNGHLLRMWRRIIPIHPWVLDLVRVSRRLPGHARHVLPLSHERDVHGVLAGSGPHLWFTSAELRRIEEEMRALGLPSDAHLVAFHARDPAYLSAVYPEASWAYHDHRDSDVTTYLPAVRELTRRGYCAVRMGSIVEQPLGVRDEQIVDYPASGRRSELMDIALSARCRFFLGNDSGLFFLPVVFRRRVALTNFILLSDPPIWSRDDLWITKKVLSRPEARYLTFHEMVRLPSRTEEYAARGLEVVGNTAEEILDLAVEMDERLNGTWRSADADERLQERLRSVLSDGASMGPNLSRMGSAFLRQNAELLA